MNKRIIKTISLFSFIICVLDITQGSIGSPSQIESQDDTAEIYIIRDKSLISGSGRRWNVLLDGREIIALRIGEYTKLNLEVGIYSREHRIDYLCGPKATSEFIYCEPQKKYYFLVGPGSIERLDEEQGLSWISRSKYIKIE